MYCDGSSDTSRTDIVSALSYLIDILPAAGMSGPCDEGYYCEAGSYVSNEFAAQEGQYT